MNNSMIMNEQKSNWFPFGVNTNKGEVPPQQQVFCFYYAGGSASVFKPWLNISKENSYIPIELPGRGIRIVEPCCTDMQEIVNVLIKKLLAVISTPFIFFGHSLGAAICFQLAWTMQERGLPLPSKIVVAGRHAPHRPDPSRLQSNMSDPEMTAELRRLNGTPKDILDNKEMLNFLLPMIRSDLKLHESFNFSGQHLSIPIIAHCGKLDDEADEAIMSHWSKVTDSDFQIREFEGDHFFVQSRGQTYFHSLEDTISEDFSIFSEEENFEYGTI